jgi:hypothetical protein
MEERTQGQTYTGWVQFMLGIAAVVGTASALTLVCHDGARRGQAMEPREKKRWNEGKREKCREKKGRREVVRCTERQAEE